LKPYVVVLTAKPAVRLPVNTQLNLEFNFSNPNEYKKVQINKIEEETTGVRIQTGLSFRVFLNAENVVTAVQSAKAFVDGIVSFITVVTGRGMDIPREEIAYELTPNQPEREFLQVFYDVPIKSPSRRQIDPKQLTDFIDSELKMNTPIAEHLRRAIRWYRLGAMQVDWFDQFNCFWIGLESLNPILQQQLSVKEETTITCPKCNHQWTKEKTVSGIKTFVLTKIEDGSSIYKKIHELRNSIMHSTKPLSELQQLAVIYAPKTAEVLFRAIMYLSEFEDWSSVKYPTILREFPMRGEVQGFLIGGEPDALGPDAQDPHFGLRHEIRATKLNEAGDVTSTVKTSLDTYIAKNVQFKLTEFRLYGDSEMKGEITENFHKVDKKKHDRLEKAIA